MGADMLHCHDILATLASGSLAFALVKSLESLAARGTLKQVFVFQSSENPFSCTSFTLTDIEQLVCRKIVHMSTGPLFVLTWPLFRCSLTPGHLDLQPCQSIATLQMLHAAQCRIMCPLVCCISAVPQWREVSTCSMCPISCKFETVFDSVPGFWLPVKQMHVVVPLAVDVLRSITWLDDFA